MYKFPWVNLLVDVVEGNFIRPLGDAGCVCLRQRRPVRSRAVALEYVSIYGRSSFMIQVDIVVALSRGEMS